MGVRNLQVGDTVWFMHENQIETSVVNQRTVYESLDDDTIYSYTVDARPFNDRPFSTYMDVDISNLWRSRGALLRSITKR